MVLGGGASFRQLLDGEAAFAASAEYYPLVAVIAFVETVTLFVRWQFKVQMDGSWVAILAGSSSVEMQEFVRAVRLRLTDMLCGRLPAMGLPRAELLRLERLMETAAEYLRFHVGTRHVLGLLTVDTIMEN